VRGATRFRAPPRASREVMGGMMGLERPVN
jgi:hypothetical protein